MKNNSDYQKTKAIQNKTSVQVSRDHLAGFPVPRPLGPYFPFHSALFQLLVMTKLTGAYLSFPTGGRL